MLQPLDGYTYDRKVDNAGLIACFPRALIAIGWFLVGGSLISGETANLKGLIFYLAWGGAFLALLHWTFSKPVMCPYCKAELKMVSLGDPPIYFKACQNCLIKGSTYGSLS